MSEKKKSVYTGRLITNRKGFGFVEVEELEDDIFIPHSGLHGAFHHDTVEVKIKETFGGRHRMEGNIINILERGYTKVIGTYRQGRGFGYVVPDDSKIADDIHVFDSDAGKAKDGDKVVVKITFYGGDHKRPEGKVVEVLGSLDDPGVDILSVIRAHGIPETFPDDVKKQIRGIRLKVPKKDMVGRKDLRDLMMVTIDGEDSKDLDDAVSLEMDGEDYILGVHIADVSNYVKEGTALDKEAVSRGTSVYLIDRVIPMLPEKLSNGICSLNEGEDRLAMSCIMRIDKKGNITDYEIAESLICVNRRMTYTAVKKILADHDKKTIKEYKELVPMFERMEKLAAILKAMRVKRGSIDFDLPESKIILDKKGRPIDIVPYEHNVATGMIEQFMLSANETVAAHMYKQGLPFLYRVHETPDADRIGDLIELMRGLGLNVDGDPSDIKPVWLQKMLGEVAGRPEEVLIRSLSLRSMKRARYSTECLGHFGLAVLEYTHFTSPIRRYPDLQIHRILKDEIHGRLDHKQIAHYVSILDGIAKRSSDRECAATDAEREADKIKMAEFMEYHIGEEFDGVISGVTGWGMYVQLKNTVEGMVPVAKIAGDDYDYSEREYALVGRYTGRRFTLGQPVSIRVVAVDLALKSIEFELAGADALYDDDLEKRKAKGKYSKKKSEKRSDKKFGRKSEKRSDKKSDKKSGKRSDKNSDKKFDKKKPDKYSDEKRSDKKSGKKSGKKNSGNKSSDKEIFSDLSFDWKNYDKKDSDKKKSGKKSNGKKNPGKISSGKKNSGKKSATKKGSAKKNSAKKNSDKKKKERSNTGKRYGVID